MITIGDLNGISSLSANAWNQQNGFQQAANTVGAALVDVGVTMWNSVANVATFGNYDDISTRSVLQSIGADGAVGAYDNNRDTIDLLSFVGGVFIPGGAAIKLSRAVRAGMKSTSFLSPVRHKEDLLKFEDLIKNAKTGSAEYKNLKRSMYLRGQAENAMDVVAGELAIMGTFNAHPFMEDYFEDPVKNIGISLALGGVVGGAISGLISRAEISNTLGRVESGIADEVIKNIRGYATPYSDTSSAIIQLDLAAKNLDNIANAPTITPAAKALANNMSASMRASIGKIEEQKVSEAILKGIKNEDERGTILSFLADPRFIGTEKLDFYTPSGKPNVKGNSTIQRVASAIFRQEEIDMATGESTEKFIRDNFFSQELGAFISKKDADLIANVADITTPVAIAKKAKTYSLKQVTSDFKDKAAFANGGELEADYLARLQFFSKQKTSDLLRAELIATDLPAINGWIGAVNDRLTSLREKIQQIEVGPEGLTKEQSALVEELGQLKKAQVKVFESDRVKLVDLEEVNGLPEFSVDPTDVIKPTLFDDIEKEITAGGIKPLVNTTYGESKNIANNFYEFIKSKTGVNTNHNDIFYKVPLATIEKFADDFAKIPSVAEKIAPIITEGSNLTVKSALMLARWIGGSAADKEIFRNAMASARTLRNGMDSITPFHSELTEILNSPLVKQQQEILKRHADGKGNIYLVRGMTRDPQGDTTVSSFTHNRAIAKGFADQVPGGTVGTYKISVDDVVGYLYNGEREWLVGATTRDAQAAASKGIKKPTGFNAPKFNSYSVQSLSSYARSTKLESIASDLRNGQPVELVSLKYNINPELTTMLASGDPKNIYARAASIEQHMGDAFNQQFNRWQSASQIPEAFAATRRTLKVTAKQSNILGSSGEILEKQRQAILGLSNLTRAEKSLLNNESFSEGGQHLASKFAMLDKQFSDINKLFIEDAVASSKSALAKQLNNRLVDTEWTNILREGLNEFVNGKGGNPLYSSADFVTSRMGDIGRLVTELGDTRVHLVNKMFEQLMTPASNQMRKLATDQVARTEFAIFDNLRQSTKGLLRYDPNKRTFVTTGDKIQWDRPSGSFVKYETNAEGQLQKIAVEGVEAFPEQVVKSDAVHEALVALQAAGDEVWEMQATLNKLKGTQTPSDVGFWVPSTNLVNSNRAFILDKNTSAVKMIVGKDEADLKLQMANLKLEPHQAVLSPSDVDRLKLSNHGDLLDEVGRADVEQIKKGIGLATPDISSDRLADIVNGFKSRLNYQASNFMENSLYDVTSKLDYLSAYNRQLTDKQGRTGFLSAVKQMQTKDTARDIKAILTGNSQIGSQEFMGYVNKFTSAGIYFGIKTFQKAWELAKPTVRDGTVDYNKFADTLAAEGIENPFKVFDKAARPLLYERAKNSGYSVTPDRIVNAGNALAATMALKFGELAQPLVNALSLPILQISTISRAVKAEQINGATDLLAASPISVMYNGVRRATSQLPENQKYIKYFEEEGLLASTISEVDEVIKQSRFGTGGVVGGLEKALDSKFVEVMSKPSEMTESLVRRVSLMTGVELAKRIYGPAASDRQITIFARDFLKQTIGNYSTSQRPMMFQGTFGAAMGLFQTYMLTYAQNMYRHLDLKDYKGLGQTMLAQGGIFGAGSLPGFQPVSQMIGENFSDDNVDLVTGTYRGLSDAAANILIYGLPSNLAPALHTRGDVTPRIPTGFSTFVAPSMIGQVLESMVGVGKSILQADRNSGQAFMEALSMQSVSRPIARLSEIASGYSVTRAGNQIAGPEEVWSWQGIMARVFSTRPLNEAKAREAIHLNSVYGSANSESRRAVLETLRTAIRNDSIDSGMMDNLAYEYMRTGSPQGFRQAVNQAFMENANDKLVDLHSKLGNSPLMWMLDDLD